MCPAPDIVSDGILIITNQWQVNECMEGVCKIYEEHLKRTNPNIPSITYDISQLFDFIDQVCQWTVGCCFV